MSVPSARWLQARRAEYTAAVEIPRPRAPATRNERIAGRILSSAVALTATYFFVLLYDMVSPVVFAAVDTGGEAPTRTTTRRSAAGSLIMIVLAGGWAYAVWVSFRYVWSHRFGTVYSRAAMAFAVALGGGSVVQAVFALLVALEVEQGSLTPALITVPVLMGAAAAAFLLGRFLRRRSQQSNESRNV